MAIKPQRISLAAARRLAIQCQGLGDMWRPAEGKEGAAQAITRLGYVQIDTIAVIERAHHHTLWSRCPDYAPDMLHVLQAEDRRVFEYWTHAASYIPMAHYRYYIPGMRARRESKRTRDWLGANGSLVQHVLERIRAEGPLGSADFEAPEGFKRGTWWSSKPAKQALEVLFDIGDLMVSERRGFERLYDLRERVLPPETDTTVPDAQERVCFMIRTGLASLGVATPRHILWGRGQTSAMDRGVAELVEAGEAVPIEIEGLDGRNYYCLAECLEGASHGSESRQALHLLSPFDNLIISRARLNELFGFDYTLESYMPEAKRRYGYYCLPVLWGERFVGRLDPKAQRDERALRIRRLMLEPGFQPEERFLRALMDKLVGLARFNGCERVFIESAEPGAVAEALSNELGQRQGQEGETRR